MPAGQTSGRLRISKARVTAAATVVIAVSYAASASLALQNHVGHSRFLGVGKRQGHVLHAQPVGNLRSRSVELQGGLLPGDAVAPAEPMAFMPASLAAKRAA